MSFMATESIEWSTDTVAVVTGANRGIGQEIVRQLLEHGLTVILTARDSTKGNASLDSLKAAGHDAVYFHQLDVTNSGSIEKFAVYIEKNFGGLDILVNNAGVGGPYRAQDLNYEWAKEIFDTNYYGVKNLTSRLLPLLRASLPHGARIVMVGARGGLLDRLGSESIKAKLRDVQHLSEGVVDSVAAKYLEDVKTGVWQQEGWSHTGFGYSESKVLLNAYTRALAKCLPEKLYVNTMCPGFTRTAMSSGYIEQAAAAGVDVKSADFPLSQVQEKSVNEGADTAVWLALHPTNGYPQGLFFADRQLLSF